MDSPSSSTKDEYEELEVSEISEEGTDVASECDDDIAETFPLVQKAYQFKVSMLRDQIIQLENGLHPAFLQQKKKIEKTQEDHVVHNTISYEYKVKTSLENFLERRNLGLKEHDEKEAETLENFIVELDEQKRMLEQERSVVLGGEQPEPKPVMTRKLRRRPNEPAPSQEKRKKTPSLQINCLLDEKDIAEDLQLASACLAAASMAENALNVAELMNKHYHETRIEDGKLLYEKRWFLRGQPVYIEGKTTPRFSAIISAIGRDTIYVKKTIDSSKFRVGIVQLLLQKVTIRKRAA